MAADFTLPRESIEITPDFAVAISEYENMQEQRKLRHPDMVIGFKVTTPDLTRTQAKQYWDHFIVKYGAFTSFTILNPVDQLEYTVRYVPGSFNVRHAGGYFKCSFELKRLK